ncbi:MAG: hypothetical protein K2X60_08710 [Xanthobacteraceae bacterium]|nr:hypothetical protein [Xanthobacteraceae bacterium]
MDVLQIIDIAEAAGGAFAVDTADVNEIGSCKVESWLQAASNTDFAAVVNPACVVDVSRPVEFSTQVTSARSIGAWSTSLAPKAKTNLVPTSIGAFGFAAELGASVDAVTGENTSVFAYVPATYRFSETMRLDLSGGWLWDRTVDRHYFTYGAAMDIKLNENISWTGEVFGQAGTSDDTHVVQPRFQTGLRYRPIETFSLDVIYGRNITGENANWITVGTTIRFPPK